MASSDRPAPVSTLSRRRFLGAGASSAVLLGTGIWSSGCDVGLLRRSEGRARNIIFMVSDGMSSGALAMADHASRRWNGWPSNWMRLYEEGRARRGLMDMASLDSLATDSAASSAWGCGHSINNGAINHCPDGAGHMPILAIARSAGKATGLVSTARITHATPAGFAAVVPSRDMEDEIAAQYLDRRVDVLLGGGRPHFDAERREDGRDLAGDFVRAGYHVANNKAELGLAPAEGPLLGLFRSSHMPYALDHANSPSQLETVPTLVEMTRIALDRLSDHRGGFVLQVEGGRIDHAAHANDVGGVIFDQLAFDAALGEVIEFADARADTLVIVTTDHGNANPGLNGVGTEYGETNERFDLIREFRHTTEWVISGLDGDSSLDAIRQRIEAATNLQVTEAEARAVRQALRGDYSPVYRTMRSARITLGKVLANHVSVGWSGRTHTSDYVELAAFGPGSEQIKAFQHGTELFELMVTTAGMSVAAHR